MNQKIRPLLFGLGASLALLAVYFIIMSLARASFAEAFDQLNRLRVWIIPLILTFGIQVGLYIYVKDYGKRHMMASKATTISSFTSGTAMLACCAHHLTDILPIVGLSIFATFLANYQTYFLGIGILFNCIGIGTLIYQFQKLKTYEK